MAVEINRTSEGRSTDRPSDVEQKRARWKRCATVAATVVWWLATVVMFVGLAAAWTAGWRLQVVRTSSMEPTVPRGSLTLVSPIGANEVVTDGIYAFRDPGDRTRVLLHRVVGIDVHEDGRRFFITRGDANQTADPLQASGPDIQGRLRWHVPRLGLLVSAFRPPVSYLVFVGVPLLFGGMGAVIRRRRKQADALAPGICPACGTVARSPWAT